MRTGPPQVSDGLVGKIGRVTVTIRPPRFGEVLVLIRGGSEHFAAASDEAISVGTQVVVVSHDHARTVTVTPFTTDPPVSG
jgi:membrane protein implicated in regulation of membrane protease activity